MQNKYLIKASRKFWFWFWTQLMNGFAPSDLHGNYKRPKDISINSEYDINNENGKIYLLVGHSCPWCQRTLLMYEIKDLSKKVKVIFLKADVEHGEWIFNKKIKGFMRLSDLYKKANKKIIFRATFGAKTFICAISLAATLLPTVSIFTAASNVRNLAALSSILDSAI